MDYPKSVRFYKDECDFVAELLANGEWLHQDDFDKKSFAWRTDLSRKATASYMRYEDKTLLHFPENGDLNLLVLQQFCLADLAEAREVDGKIEYRRKQPATANAA